jgi:ABC-2 type transport system permease protein
MLTWIVPFGFATFYPSAALLRSDTYTIYAWLLPVITTVFLMMSVALWDRGVRNYSSTGS